MTLTKTVEPAIHYNPDLTQIINGEEVMSPSPFLNHQSISSKLFRVLDDFVDTGNLGTVCFAPLDVIFEEDYNVLQPDLMFISQANAGIMQDWIRGVPDLVVEVISPSSVKMDTIIKKGIYEKYGVPECWLVFPKKKIIEIYLIIESKYELYQRFGLGEVVNSPTLPELNFLPDRIFDL